MKKFAVVFLAFALLCGAALAETVYVTITDGQGAICLAYSEVEVSDVDGDGAITIYDALYCAHAANYADGAEAGFAAEDQGYGPSLTKLWGEENGGSYGYCVNNASAMSLADAVAEGDHVQAYAYQDLEAWSDQFSYFELTGDDGEGTYTLTLNTIAHDADWNPVVAPVAGATITLDGEDSDLVTGEDGSVSVTLPEARPYTVSAHCDEIVLVPPVIVLGADE